MLKNAIVYSVVMPCVDKMLEAMDGANLFARKPTTNQQSTFGWGKHPVSNACVTGFPGGYALTLETWKKTIKPSILRELVNETVEMFDRPVKKKEKDMIREDIITDLLLTTPPEKKLIHAYYLTDAAQLIVDAGTAKDAEVMCAFIRRTLGSLKTTTLHVDTVNGLTKHIRDYLENPNQQFLPHYKLGSELKLVDLNGAAVHYRNLNLTDEGTAGEIIALIDEAFMTVKSVEMSSLDDGFSFNLTDGFKFKKIKFEATDGEFEEDAAAETYTISRLVNQLVDHFDTVSGDSKQED